MIRVSTLCVGVLLLGACQSLATETPAMQATLSSNFGEATRANIAAMAIAPSEDELNNRYIPADRERAALALDTYRKGAVELESVKTGGEE